MTKTTNNKEIYSKYKKEKRFCITCNSNYSNLVHFETQKHIRNLQSPLIRAHKVKEIVKLNKLQKVLIDKLIIERKLLSKFKSDLEEYVVSIISKLKGSLSQINKTFLLLDDPIISSLFNEIDLYSNNICKKEYDVEIKCDKKNMLIHKGLYEKCRKYSNKSKSNTNGIERNNHVTKRIKKRKVTKSFIEKKNTNCLKNKLKVMQRAESILNKKLGKRIVNKILLAFNNSFGDILMILEDKNLFHVYTNNIKITQLKLISHFSKTYSKTKIQGLKAEEIRQEIKDYFNSIEYINLVETKIDFN